jgi:hypothetical protein
MEVDPAGPVGVSIPPTASAASKQVSANAPGVDKLATDVSGMVREAGIENLQPAQPGIEVEPIHSMIY